MISKKTYKILGVLNLILSSKERCEDLFSESDLDQSGLDRGLFTLFLKNPLNNILHNAITRFILNINKLSFETAKIQFSKNEDFFGILENISKNSASKEFRHGNCYMGHIKKIANEFAKTLLEKEKDERWVLFRDNFLNLENEKENTALGDVYINNDDDEMMFSFTLDEIREKYSVFLGFTEEELPEPAGKVEEEKTKEEEEVSEGNGEAIDEHVVEAEPENKGRRSGLI